MKHEIIFIREVAKRIGTSIATVNRYLALRRQGIGNFPLPISPFKGRGRWLESDIDRYLESLSACNATPRAPPKQKKERNYQNRQELAEKGLNERHGIKKEVK
jgi:predicted DNA-binding transcriptional regulator AlpA